MTEEEIKAAELAEAEEAKAKAEQEALEGLSEEEREQKIAEKEAEDARLQEIDYEAIAKAEKERREAAERVLAEDRYKRDEARRRDEKSEDDDKLITKKDLDSILTRERQAIQKDSQESIALSIARSNTSSEAEAQAALLFWKTRILPTGNLEEDVKFAIGGLNHKRVVAKNAELARALKGKGEISNDSASSHYDGLPKVEPKLSENSPLKEYKYMGNGIYSLKLNSGKTLYRNTKAKSGERKSWVE